MKAVGSTQESGCSVGLSHTGCACVRAVVPSRRADRDGHCALRDPESRRSLCDEDSAVLPDVEKKAQSVFDFAEEAFSTARETVCAASVCRCLSPAVSVLVAVLLTYLAITEQHAARWGCSAEEVMPWRVLSPRFVAKAGPGCPPTSW